MKDILKEFKEFYPGYFVSKSGQIARYGKSKSGYFIKKVRFLKTCEAKGYFLFTLSDGKIRKTLRVHSVVAETFLPKKMPGQVVNHKDGVKTNNNIENLEYVSQKENKRHAIMMGLSSKTPRSRLNENIVRKIRKEFRPATKSNARELAIKYGVDKQVISNIGSGRVWKHV